MNTDYIIYDAIELCLSRNSAVFTDFCDPVKTGALLALIEKTNESVKAKTFGGVLYAERTVIGVCPDFMEDIDEFDFPINRIKISYDERFTKNITHRDILGALIGSGFDRSKIGDIIVQQGYSYALVKREISGAVLGGLTSVGRAAVRCEAVEFMDIDSPQDTTENTASITSARLDCVMAKCFLLSRTDTKDAVNSGKVFVNWEQVKNGTKDVKPGDNITIRGQGRVRIIDVYPKTKSVGFVVEYSRFS